MIRVFEEHRSLWPKMLWAMAWLALALALGYFVVFSPFFAALLWIGLLLLVAMFSRTEIIPALLALQIGLGTFLAPQGGTPAEVLINRFSYLALYYGAFGIWFLLVLARRVDLEPLKSRGFKALLLFLAVDIASILYVNRISSLDFRGEHYWAYITLRADLDCTIVFVLTSTLLRSRRAIKWVVAILCVCTVIAITIGALEIALNRPLLLARVDPNFTGQYGHSRVTANFFDPNYFGKFLIMIILLLLPLSFHPRSPRWVFVPLGVGCFAVFLFTFSGSGTVGLAAGVAVLFWQRRRWPGLGSMERDRSRAWNLLLAITPVVTMVLTLALAPQVINVYRRIEHEIGAFGHSTRVDMDIAAFRMFASSPVYGAGLGMFPKLFYEFKPGVSIAGPEEYWSHNTLARVAAEKGTIGLLVLFALWYLIGRDLFALGRIKDTWLQRLQIGIGATFAAYIAHSFLYPEFFRPMVWFVIGMGYAVARVGSEQAI